MMQTRKITLSALLLAVAIVLTRIFATYVPMFGSPAIRFDLGYAVLMYSGVLLGPLYGAIVGIMADLIGATLFPVGSFYPGFTVNSFLVAFIPSLIYLLYRKVPFIKKHISLIHFIYLLFIQVMATISMLFFINKKIFSDPVIILKPSLAAILLLGLLVYLALLFFITWLIDLKGSSHLQLSSIIATTVMIIVGCFLTPTWLSHMYNMPYGVYFIPRLILLIPYNIIPIILLNALIGIRPRWLA